MISSFAPRISVASSLGVSCSASGGSSATGTVASTGVTTAAVLIKSVNPRYPTQAQRASREGWVIVSYTVDAEGNVNGVKVVNSEPRHIFDRAAVDAVERWKYTPAMRDGKAVESNREQRIMFKLGQ